MLFDFKILNVSHSTAISGTSLQGYITENYATLVEVFGEPTYSEPSGDDKVNTEWSLKFEVREEGERESRTVVATIYDWKESSADVARSAINHRWHIGGTSNDAVDVVTQAIEAKITLWANQCIV